MMSLAFFLILTIGMNVRADMGPKPSITITVVNAPDHYYVALLDNYNHQQGGDSELHLDKVDEESVNAYLHDFQQHDWKFFESPVGNNILKSNATGEYHFTYMVPNPFKVIIIDEDGNVYVSEEHTKKEFDAVCTYDVATGVITEDVSDKVFRRVLYVAICYLLTLLIELLALKIFDYPYTKLNVFFVVLINTITNIPFSLFVMNLDVGIAMLIAQFLLEIPVIVVECLYYLFTLRYQDGTIHRKRNLLYGLCANLISASLGIIGLFIYLLLK